MENKLEVIFFYHAFIAFQFVICRPLIDDLSRTMRKTSGVAIFLVKIKSLFFKCLPREYS